MNAVDFGDLLLHNLTLLHRQSRHPRRLSAPLPLSAGRRVSGHQRRAVSVAAAAGPAPPQSVLRRRRRPVDLQLARRRDRQHPALREGFSGRRDHPARAELPLDAAHPRRRRRDDRHRTAAGSARRCGPTRTRATRSWCAPCGTPRRKRAGSATRSRRCSARAMPLSEIAILVRAGFQTREFEERFISLALPYRVIGGPRFYERQEIRDALAYLRLVNQPADDLAFERIVNTPRRGIGSATLQQLHAAVARASGCRSSRRRGCLIAGDRLRPAARNALAAFVAALDRWRAQADAHLAYRPGADRARRIGLHRDVAGRPLARRRRAARKPEGAGRRDGRVREPRRLSRTCQPGHGQRRRERAATWSI